MRRATFKAAMPSSRYRPSWPLPPAEDLRRFARECHKLAHRESNAARRALFRQMEAAWTALAAQVERTDDLMLKLQARQCETLN
jgi:hypothetical protein